MFGIERETLIKDRYIRLKFASFWKLLVVKYPFRQCESKKILNSAKNVSQKNQPAETPKWITEI